MKRPNKNEFIFSMMTKKNGDYSSLAIPNDNTTELYLRNSFQASTGQLST